MEFVSLILSKIKFIDSLLVALRHTADAALAQKGYITAKFEPLKFNQSLAKNRFFTSEEKYFFSHRSGNVKIAQKLKKSFLKLSDYLFFICGSH